MCSKFTLFKDCHSLENVRQRKEKVRSVSALYVGKTRDISARCKMFFIPNAIGHTLFFDLLDRNFRFQIHVLPYRNH